MSFPEIILHARAPGEVTSHQDLDVQTDDPAVRLMIFSGIAAPNITVDSDDWDDLVRKIVIVKMGVTASAIHKAVVQVGLASISNDESTFVFAVESADVETDPTTSEIQLRVQAAVLGDDTALHRFSYQVVAHVTKLASQIAGNIRVPRNLLDLSNKTLAQVQATFRVTANLFKKSAGGFLEEKIPVATGKLGPVTSAGDDSFVSYEIDGCPLNTNLLVWVDVGGDLEGLSALHVPGSGPNPVHLTKLVPAVGGVNFVVYRPPVA